MFYYRVVNYKCNRWETVLQQYLTRAFLTLQSSRGVWGGGGCGWGGADSPEAHAISPEQ